MPDLAEQLRRSFDSVPPVALEDVRRRVDQRPSRRPRRLTAGLAIAFTGALVLATVVFVATRPTSGGRQAPGVTAIAGGSWHTVSLDGVGLEVPSDWPIEDSARTGFCGTPFPTMPAVFIGPSYSGGMPCLAFHYNAQGRAKDFGCNGSAVQASALVSATLPDGQRVQQLRYPGSQAELVEDFFFHGVEVEVGEGKDPGVTARILRSLTYSPSRPDTAVPRPCALSPEPNTPTGPRVVTTTMRLDRGAAVLSAPRLGQTPLVTAAEAFRTVSTGPLGHSEILLGRFSFNRTVEPHSFQPAFHGQLAWVLYRQPNSPTIQGCGGWGLYAVDATTGQNSGLVSYEQGP
jgi:hypothetical protein